MNLQQKVLAGLLSVSLLYGIGRPYFNNYLDRRVDARIQILEEQKEKEKIKGETFKQMFDPTSDSERQEKILTLFESYGIQKTSVDTNGYAYNFTFNGFYINLVDQDDETCDESRLYVTMLDEKFKKEYQDMDSYLNRIRFYYYLDYDDTRKLVENYNYREALYYGCLDTTIRDIINLTNVPKEDIIKRIETLREKGGLD